MNILKHTYSNHKQAFPLLDHKCRTVCTHSHSIGASATLIAPHRIRARWIRPEQVLQSQ